MKGHSAPFKKVWARSLEKCTHSFQLPMSGSFTDLGTPVMVPASFLCPKSGARWPVGMDQRVPQSATPKPTQGSSSSSSPQTMHFASSLHLLFSHHESSTHARCFFKSTTFFGVNIPNQDCCWVWTQDLLPTILVKGKSTGLGVKDLDSCPASAVTGFCCFPNICRMLFVCVGVFLPMALPSPLPPGS